MNAEPNVPLPYFDILHDSSETAALEFYLEAVASIIASLDMVHPQERQASGFLGCLSSRVEFAIDSIPLLANSDQSERMRNIHRRMLVAVKDYRQRQKRGLEYLEVVASVIADLDEQHPSESRTTEWFMNCIQQRLKQALAVTNSWESIDAINRHPSVVHATLTYQHQRRLQLGSPDKSCTLDPPCPNHP